MSRDKTNPNKLFIFKKILENKHILFGSFSDRLTKQDKLTKWGEIRETALRLGLISSDKTKLYVRDTFWPNLKKATVAKLDNARRTGTGGGKKCVLNQMDHIVIDIIGKESPAITSLGVSETWGEPGSLTRANVDTVQDLALIPERDLQGPSTECVNLETYPTIPERDLQGPFTNYVNLESYRTIPERISSKPELFKKKISLQIRYMEIKNVKMEEERKIMEENRKIMELEKENKEIENYKLKLEKELKINHSKFTKDLM